MDSDSNTEENIAHFDAAAEEWDKPHRVEMSRTIARRLREEIAFSSGWSILDFGCGTGCVLLPLAEHVHKATGADTSKGMIAVLQNKAATGNIDNVTALCTDVLAEPRPEEFDLVYSCMVFHHLADPGRAMARLAGMLKPGGLLAIVDLEPEDGSFHGDNREDVPHHGIDPEDLKSAAGDAGLKEPNCRRFHSIEKEIEGDMRTFHLFLFTARRSLD